MTRMEGAMKFAPVGQMRNGRGIRLRLFQRGFSG
jgi:hypothetical protein